MTIHTKNKTRTVKFYNFITAFLLIFVILVCGFPFLATIIGERIRLDYNNKFYSTNLLEDTIKDLCLHKLIPISVVDCNNNQVVIRYSDIPNIVNSIVDKETSFEDIQKILENYLDTCYKVTYKSYQYMCIYHLMIIISEFYYIVIIITR